MISCPRCNSSNHIIVTVDLEIQGDASIFHRVNKSTIRKRSVLLTHANWPSCSVYCEKCQLEIMDDDNHVD